MPNFASYSPWQDASANAIRPAGHALSQLAVEIAKARYNRNNRAAELGLELEKLQQQELLNQAHGRLYDAQTTEAGARSGNLVSSSRFNDARTAHQQAVDEAAGQFQRSVVAHDYPNPMHNGPTLADQAQMLSARQHGSAALVAGLHGTPQEAFPVHNIGANNIAIDPMSGIEVGKGAIEMAPGGMYQAPGEDPVYNENFRPQEERPYFAPAGSTPFDRMGQPIGQQTGFRPTAPGSRSSAVDARLVGGLVSGDIDETSPLYDAAMRASTNSGPAQATNTAPQTQRPQHSPEEESLLNEANAKIQRMVIAGSDPQQATNIVMQRLKQLNPNFNPK